MRYSDATFWWDNLMRDINELFMSHFDKNKNIYNTPKWDILMRQSVETYWWNILMRHSDNEFLVRHSGKILW